MSQPRKPIADLIGELRSWLPNYDHGPSDYPTLLWRILASAPGGDEAEDMGYEPFQLGWQEIEQLGRVLEAIQDKRDVEDLVRGLLTEEKNELDEARRRHSHQAPVTYPKSPSGQYVLKRDGREVTHGTEDEIWKWLHNNHGYSVDHALRYEGYSIEPVEHVRQTAESHRPPARPRRPR